VRQSCCQNNCMHEATVDIVIVATFSFVSGFSGIRLSSAMCLYATYMHVLTLIIEAVCC